MGEEDRKLRNRLRAHGRQLGDQRDSQKGTQSIERLVREMAYEHWHRMLFARYLAENQLLIEPSTGVAITLEECEELAADEGTNLWELAASYAQGMLPQIFRIDDPVLAITLPLEIRQQLQALVTSLDVQVFTASDSLGWTYQFWQTAAKKAINESDVKIGPDELLAVTQLFTEDYMVDFLLDNTLGAWHAGKVIAANPNLAETVQSESELRQAVSLPGCQWSYLRFIQGETHNWTPAAGIYQGWPTKTSDLKCLDPCMGSGHFVVALFERLVALRQSEENLNEAAAVAAVIAENLFGLEIDPRCTQIAAFNLALAAWRRLGHCPLPAMNLACSGLAPNTSEAEWLALAGENERLRNGMGRLYQLFDKASVLGSLINLRAGDGELLVAGFQELEPLLEIALAQESKDDSTHELAVTARGLTKAAEILASQFTLIATNVPYLGRGDQPDKLKDFSYQFYPDSKSELATTFLESMLLQAGKDASVAIVIPRIWLTYTRYYEALRKKLLNTQTWNVLGVLGKRAFAEIDGEVVDVVLLILSRCIPSSHHKFSIVDATSEASIPSKATALQAAVSSICGQKNCIDQPGHVIVSDGAALSPISSKRLIDYAIVLEGISRGDTERFDRGFWELASFKQHVWKPLLESATDRGPYGGCRTIFLWQEGRGAMALSESARVQGVDAWEKNSIFVSRTHLNAFLSNGAPHAQNGVAVVPRSEKDLAALWAYCSSEDYRQEVLRLNQKLIKPTGALDKVPFDLAHWQKVAADKYPNGLPKPFSSDPSQWLFDGHPTGADQPLHVAVARLMGYQWPRQTGSSFPDCPALDSDGLEALADVDAIVCLSAVRSESTAAVRLRKLLAAAFHEEWSSPKERELLLASAVENNAKKPEPDLESWLRNSFFSEHCKLFRNRPFIWQVWDGNPNGFSALVNYHRLAAPNGQGRKTIEKLTSTYLGDWIARQRQDQADGVNGADDRLAAALDLQGQLTNILNGEPPYDIFVRWKPLHQQVIGWDPDINDGVRLNIRPFLSAQLRKGGKAGAGILRAKPGTIKWSRDKGNEQMRSKDEFPWFWGWDETNHALATDFGAPVPGAPPVGNGFDGKRWNDLNYTRAAKEAARAKQRGVS
jgi:hypothetical protein